MNSLRASARLIAFSGERVLPGHDGPHLLLDRRQVLGAQRTRKLEIVVETLGDCRADGELRPGEHLEHRFRHDVRERVPDFQEPGLSCIFHFNPPYDKAPLGCFVPVLDAAIRRASKDEKPKGALRGSTLIRRPCTVFRAVWGGALSCAL